MTRRCGFQRAGIYSLRRAVATIVVVQTGGKDKSKSRALMAPLDTDTTASMEPEWMGMVTHTLLALVSPPGAKRAGGHWLWNVGGGLCLLWGAVGPRSKHHDDRACDDRHIWSHCAGDDGRNGDTYTISANGHLFTHSSSYVHTTATNAGAHGRSSSAFRAIHRSERGGRPEQLHQCPDPSRRSAHHHCRLLQQQPGDQ